VGGGGRREERRESVRWERDEEWVAKKGSEGKE